MDSRDSITCNMCLSGMARAQVEEQRNPYVAYSQRAKIGCNMLLMGASGITGMCVSLIALSLCYAPFYSFFLLDSSHGLPFQPFDETIL